MNMWYILILGEEDLPVDAGNAIPNILLAENLCIYQLKV